jgi:hypothetical protein
MNRITEPIIKNTDNQNSYTDKLKRKQKEKFRQAFFDPPGCFAA